MFFGVIACNRAINQNEDKIRFRGDHGSGAQAGTFREKESQR